MFCRLFFSKKTALLRVYVSSETEVSFKDVCWMLTVFLSVYSATGFNRFWQIERILVSTSYQSRVWTLYIWTSYALCFSESFDWLLGCDFSLASCDFSFASCDFSLAYFFKMPLDPSIVVFHFACGLLLMLLRTPVGDFFMFNEL